MGDIERLLARSLNCELLEPCMIDAICSKVKEYLSLESNVRSVSSPVTLVGDVHGQFADLLELFKIGGMIPYTNYLFLGDYVDRGGQSIETMTLLFLLKIRYPSRLTLLRGNHESRQITQVYGFYAECERKYNTPMVWQCFTSAFDFLPVAALVDDIYLGVHGGLSPHAESLDDIRRLHRYTEIPHQGPLADLMWSDPSEDKMGFTVSPRGAGYIFGRDKAEEFCHINGLNTIYRAHQLCMNGYQHCLGGWVVTVWSAPNYLYRFGNKASCLEIYEDGSIYFNVFDQAPEFDRSVTSHPSLLSSQSSSPANPYFSPTSLSLPFDPNKANRSSPTAPPAGRGEADPSHTDGEADPPQSRGTTASTPYTSPSIPSASSGDVVGERREWSARETEESEIIDEDIICDDDEREQEPQRPPALPLRSMAYNHHCTVRPLDGSAPQKDSPYPMDIPVDGGGGEGGEGGEGGGEGGGLQDENHSDSSEGVELSSSTSTSASQSTTDPSRNEEGDEGDEGAKRGKGGGEGDGEGGDGGGRSEGEGGDGSEKRERGEGGARGERGEESDRYLKERKSVDGKAVKEEGEDEGESHSVQLYDTVTQTYGRVGDSTSTTLLSPSGEESEEARERALREVSEVREKGDAEMVQHTTSADTERRHGYGGAEVATKGERDEEQDERVTMRSHGGERRGGSSSVDEGENTQLNDEWYVINNDFSNAHSNTKGMAVETREKILGVESENGGGTGGMSSPSRDNNAIGRENDEVKGDSSEVSPHLNRLMSSSPPAPREDVTMELSPSLSFASTDDPTLHAPSLPTDHVGHNTDDGVDRYIQSHGAQSHIYPSLENNSNFKSRTSLPMHSNSHNDKTPPTGGPTGILPQRSRFSLPLYSQPATHNQLFTQTGIGVSGTERRRKVKIRSRGEVNQSSSTEASERPKGEASEALALTQSSSMPVEVQKRKAVQSGTVASMFNSIKESSDGFRHPFETHAHTQMDAERNAERGAKMQITSDKQTNGKADVDPHSGIDAQAAHTGGGAGGGVEPITHSDFAGKTSSPRTTFTSTESTPNEDCSGRGDTPPSGEINQSITVSSKECEDDPTNSFEFEDARGDSTGSCDAHNGNTNNMAKGNADNDLFANDQPNDCRAERGSFMGLNKDPPLSPFSQGGSVFNPSLSPSPSTSLLLLESSSCQSEHEVEDEPFLSPHSPSTPVSFNHRKQQNLSTDNSDCKHLAANPSIVCTSGLDSTNDPEPIIEGTGKEADDHGHENMDQRADDILNSSTTADQQDLHCAVPRDPNVYRPGIEYHGFRFRRSGSNPSSESSIASNDYDSDSRCSENIPPLNMLLHTDLNTITKSNNLTRRSPITDEKLLDPADNLKPSEKEKEHSRDEYFI